MTDEDASGCTTSWYFASVPDGSVEALEVGVFTSEELAEERAKLLDG